MMAATGATRSDQAFTILLCALGGEGGGVLADWLVDTARACGHAVQGTSIPGVAQRTGATTYYIEIFPRPISELAGRKPVFGLYAVPGGVDLLVGSELLEVVRQAGAGMVSPERTAVIASSRRTLTTAEKMQLADGRIENEQLAAVLRGTARELELFDMAGMAEGAGTVVSAVMLGAVGAWLAGSGALPFPRGAYETAIRAGGKGTEASLRGFAAAWDRIADAQARRAAVLEIAAQVANGLAARPGTTVPTAVSGHFPADTHEIVALGLARVVEYQDEAYGALYLDRLQRVRDAERAANPGASQSFPTTLEVARWLALWMAFDDIVRVAELKCRASRFVRLRGEVKAGDGELLRIHDHFKPGVPEIAALLPRGPAERLQRWDRARVMRGKEPFGLPIALGTHTVFGLLALRVLAALKGQRRRGQRFAVEQTLIDRWLGSVEQGLRSDADLGHEIACCGRMIKGYGSTNERGKANLLHIIEHLAPAHDGATPAQRAEAVRAARGAALVDDAGQALDQVLAARGAAPLPLAEQPVRIVRRSRAPREAA